MKKVLCLLCVLLSILNTNAQEKLTEKPFAFTGKITGSKLQRVYFDYVNAANLFIHDSCKLVNGNFRFSGKINGPVQASFYQSNSNSVGVDDSTFTNLFLEAGSVSGLFAVSDFKKGKITGSKSQLDYAVYVKQTDALDRKWKAVLDALEAAKNHIDEEKNYAIYSKGLPTYRSEKQQLSRQFIRQHPQSFVSAYLLYDEIFKLPLDSSKFYFSQLSSAVQSGTDGQAISRFIAKEEAIAVNKPAPDFTQPDTIGKMISLHDFKGKYVLLDFWASWCVPCRKESPYLREAYALYKDKGFTIISLSLDRQEDKQAWLEAIKKDSLTWTQLCDFKVWNNEVANSYNVMGKGIPANFLISPNGIILAMNLHNNELKEKLKNYLD